MYIDPFIAGLVAGILVCGVCLISYGVYLNRKK